MAFIIYKINAMKFTKTHWQHDNDDLPNYYYSQFDDNDIEIYRVEIYPTGKILYGNINHQDPYDDIWLDGMHYDEIHDIEDEMMTFDISQDEFNQYWCVANNPHFNPKL